MKVGILKRRSDTLLFTPSRFDLEVLESRICPSTIHFGAITVTPGDPLTSADNVLLQVDSGRAIVYVSDFNSNGRADSGDIVGISISSGINLTSFVDIHGDIVTNLNKDGTLSGANHDGSVLLAKSNIGQLNIEGSVEGQILAGGSIGKAPKTTVVNGVSTATVIPINIEGDVQVIAAGSAAAGRSVFADVDTTLNGVAIGPVTLLADDSVSLKVGPSIQGVQIGGAENLTLIRAGDGAPGKAGGSISDITQLGSGAEGTFLIRAGDGGDNIGKSGGNGGSIWNIECAANSNFVVISGFGGDGGPSGNGGAGGHIQNVHLSSPGGFAITAGSGGDGGKSGGAGGFVSSIQVGSGVGAQVQSNFILTDNLNEDLTDTNLPIPDLLTVNSADNSVSVFLNDGQGNFTLSSTYSVGTNPQRAVLTDLNGDGHLDLLVTNEGSNDVSVLLGNGDGTFQAPTSVPVGTAPIGIAVVPTFGEISADIVVANSGDNTISIIPGVGDGTFDLTGAFTVPTGLSPSGLVVGDLDLSGTTDLAVANSGGNNVSVILQINGIFQPSQNFDVGINPVELLQNGLDLITVNSGDNTVTILPGEGGSPTIHYGDPVTVEVGQSPSSAVLTNLNGDLYTDMVVTNTGDNTITVLLGGPGDSFTTSTVSVGSRPASVTAADFNNDGHTDLAVANSGAASLSILFGNGDGTFQVSGTGAIKAGDGGSGDTKNGGAGGYVGIDTHSKSKSKDFSPNMLLTVASSLPIIAGDGGNGAVSGGRGGWIASVDATGGGDVSFRAGNGGSGGTKTGGDGGAIGQPLSISTSLEQVFSVVGSGVASVQAGTGGDGGKSGGLGGKIINTQFFGTDLEVGTGDGGSATVGGTGRDGGDITSSEFDSNESMTVTLGHGGDSLGKNGALGGSVSSTHFTITGASDPVDSIPDPGNFVLLLGDGGSGVMGGAGGGLKATSLLAISPNNGNDTVLFLHTGSGGSGTTNGGKAGDIQSTDINGKIGSSEGDISQSPIDVIIDLGAGGAGVGGTGGAGGFLDGLRLTQITGTLDVNNVSGGTSGRGGDGLTGGRGGKVSDITLTASEGVIGGVLTLVGGDGGNATQGNAGQGGDVTNIEGAFEGIVDHADGTTSTGLRFQSGKGGISTGAAGGGGGDITSIKVTTGTDDINFLAGDGGQGLITGGNGGSLANLQAQAGSVMTLQAGNGGAATGSGFVETGGNGGSITNVEQDTNPSQVVQQIIAGNGGDAAGVGGVGGSGGSIDRIHVLGDIGLFGSATFGVNGMGGMFAGAGGRGETDAAFGSNGDVTNISADRIASIVAGTGAGPVAVRFVDNITVTAGALTTSVTTLGANTDGATDPGEFIFPAFDFIDTNGDGQFTVGANALHDPSETPIDGLVLADVLGAIHLPSRDPSLALFVAEASTGTFTGNQDPQAP